MKIRTAVILFLALGPTTICRAQDAPVLSADEVIAKLIDFNAQRDKLGAGYTGTRRYVLENARLNKRAEMLVSVKCDPDGTKHFEGVRKRVGNPRISALFARCSNPKPKLPSRRFALPPALLPRIIDSGCSARIPWTLDPCT